MGYNSQTPGEKGALPGNFEAKCTGRAENGFEETKSNSGRPNERKQNSDGDQARLSKVGCSNLTSGFGQRGSGPGKSGNKPACFKCGNTDRFRDRCPIWLAKTKRWTNTRHPSTKQGGGEKKGRGDEKVRVNQLGILS